ncbi:MAG: hypothetical protein IJ422_09455 [Oscillospiraceae bacterium]|nr:hypothetical protein [Oscillospiraceae bacterium]
MNEKLAEALGHVSDEHIAEAAAHKHRRPCWIGAVAAVLAVAILVGIFWKPASEHFTVSPSGYLLAGPQYPEMSPYPNEMEYIRLDGTFDDEGFSVVYDAWRADRKAQYDQPKGYADGLEDFFAASIPEFLAAGEENSVCSPVNIYMALAMLAETAGGDSRQQILDLLGARNIDKLRTQVDHVWNAHYCADDATAVVLANSLWLDEGMTYNPDTVGTLAEAYYASVYQGDLGSKEMNQALQAWLNEQTGGLLEEQAQNVELPPQTAVALASTIYYRAKWQNEFWEDANTEGIFHGTRGDQDVTYMNKTIDHGPYFWGEDYAAVYLSLRDSSKMWLILPDEGKTPAEVLENGAALEMVLGDWNSHENQKSIKVNLSLPKFDIAADTRLEESLRNLGVTAIFDEESADLTPILPEAQAWLDRVDHAARVAIDEEGVTAAAYTVMLEAGASPPPEDEVDLVLDRPFLFVITSRDNLPLFAGVVNEP